ncbi:MAG: glycosyltransferase [Gammaproteobacteria bacterium]|nr:glycosyltransferase [Gammaproteobacteria bacterium]
MRIALTAPALDGGIGRNLVNLASCWRDMGIEVDIIVDHRCPTEPPDIPAGVAVIESGGSHPIARLPWLVRYLRRRRPVGILTPVARHTVWALRARTCSRVPLAVVANVHNDYRMTLQALRPGKRHSRIAALRRYYPRCDAIVAVSQGVARSFSQLVDIPEHRLTVIPNPVVTPALVARAETPPGHPWFDAPSMPIIIWVGRMEAQKNADLLVEAFDQLRTTTECRLAFVGTGSEQPRLIERARTSPYSDAIAFLGHQKNPYGFIRRSAVLALSSNWEGFGNVLVEAMALGVPVVSTDCPSGPAEILESGRWGPLIPPNDAAALATGIRQCLEQPLAPAVLREAAQRYRSDVVARRYLHVLSGGMSPDEGAVPK